MELGGSPDQFWQRTGIEVTRKMEAFRSFPFEAVGELATAMIRQVYESTQLAPVSHPDIGVIPDDGEGFEGLAEVFRSIVTASAGLAAPSMMGHMDTAPHPAAAFTDALVSALNNNLLFRELSPFASRVEERLVGDIGTRLGLSARWTGTFASGGSIANLTALFAAVGGFAGVDSRSQCDLYLPECAHVSLRKSAAVLGIPAERLHVIAGDALGRSDMSALRAALSASKAGRKVVVGVLGSTVHGAVENIEALVEASTTHDAWLHIDAIHAGALAFSNRYRRLLNGLDGADSVAIGPQKWMYVPRVSAIVWVKGQDRFDRALGVDLPYSATGEPHRGRWGLQGSRRADAITLWAVLRYVGARALGNAVDGAVDLAREFWEMLSIDSVLEPTHVPDLNLLCFRYRQRDNDALQRAHRALGVGNVPWVSLSRWRDHVLFRSVLLSPSTNEKHLRGLIETLHHV